MTIKNEIDIELWEAIEKNYTTDNYKGAIIDSIFKLTDTIRNKTGLEGDGSSLIGQAFGGENPRIKLNKLQTDSEKDVQKGIQEILRGVYTAIRNPRSHDIHTDSKVDADAIIYFINYLLRLIDKSKLNFEEKDFLARVFDTHYVKSNEYSDLLVQEIPKRQRVNLAISTILRRNDGEIYTLGFFLESLIGQLDDVELSRVYKIVSDELKTTIDKEDIRYLVHICPAKYWTKIDKAVRLRIESILYEDFSNAVYNTVSKRCGERGSLATWITTEHLMHFNNFNYWINKTIQFLSNESPDLIAYVDNYFWDKICSANKVNIAFSLKNYFDTALDENNKEIIDRLITQIVYDEDHPWWKVFEKKLKLYPDIKYIGDDLPF